MDELYAINDAISELAARFEIRKQFAAGADDDYYEMLDDATATVAHLFWPDKY